MSDPDYVKINEIFKLGNLPAIVVTVESSLSTVSDTENTYLRIDDKRLLEKPEEFLGLVNEIYNLFIRGDITKAIKKTYIKEISIFLSDLLKEIKNVIGKAALKIMENYNITFEVGPFKVDLTKPSAD